MQTTLCYIEHDDAYLMLHRVKKKIDINKGKWIGVGGKFEQNESPEECLLREVYEETGLTLTKYQYRGFITFIQEADTEYMHLFTASEYEGEIKECDEGILKFVPKNEIMNLNLWEGDKVFLKMLMEDSSFFTMKLVYDADGNLMDINTHVY